MRIFTFLFFALTSTLALGQSCPADFDFTAVSCNEIKFTPRSNAAGTYKWRFGDGSGSTQKAPTHIFSADGSQTFNVTLITGGSCVPDTVTRSVTVNPSDLPDATIESVGIYNFVNCAPTDDPSYQLRINNTSTTKATNQRYVIDWGDGSAKYDAATLPNLTSHTYTSVGLYDIVVSVQGASGCWAQETFEFFYGSNPGGNIVPVSNQIACVPENVEFRISGTEDNPPGTIYKIWVNDGSGDTTYFNHPPPTNFSYYLTTSPCESDETANNYFNIYFEATNPCFTQSGGTIIRANKAPEMDFDADDVACEGGVIEIRNNSTPALYAVGNTCSFEMLTEWSINADPSTYDIVGGSLNDESGLDIRFNEAGEYVITLNYTPKYSNACTSPPMSQTICILPAPEASYAAVNADPESCTPLTLDVTNTSNTLETCGREATYEWLVEYVPSDCGEGDGAFTVLEGSGKDGLHGQDIKIRFESAGVYRLGLMTENECGPDTYWEEFVVAEAPLVEIEPVEDVCFDGPITITPFANISLDCTDPPAFTWDFDGGSGGDVDAQEPGPVTYNAPGVYTLRLRVSNSCGTTVVTETFEIADAPEVPEITVTDEACEQASISAQLGGSAAGLTFAWTGPDRFTSDRAEWSIANAKPKHAGVYTVVVTNAIGCTSTESYTVDVNPSAPITVEGGDVDVCIGEDVTLTATGGDTYTWTGDHISGSTGSSVVFNHDVPGVYTIVVLGTDPAGLCDASDEIKVTVHDLPVAEAGDDRVACVGEALELRGDPFSIDGKGVWTGDYVTEDGEFSAPAAGTYTVTYTYTNAGGCSDSDDLTVCVRAAPVADFTLPESAGCMPAGLTLRPQNLSSAVSDCDEATMEWSLASQKAGCFSGTIAYTEGTDENSFEPVIQVDEAGNYLLTLTVTSSCGESVHSEKVLVGEIPEMEIVEIDTLCGPQVVRMQPRGGYCDVSTTTYLWEMPTATPPATFTVLKPGDVFFAEGEHTVSLTATNFCGTYTVTETFVVAGNATIDLDVSSDQLCLNGDTQFSVINNNVGDFAGYSWTVLDPAGGVYATSSESAPSFTFDPADATGSYDVEAVMTVAGCSDILWDTTIVLGDTPDPTIDPITVDCGEDRFQPRADYGAAPELIQSVLWTFPAGSTPATSTELEPGEVILGSYGTGLEVSLTVTSACGTTTVTETFDVIEPTVVDIAFDKNGVCEGESIVVTNNSTGNGLTFTWSVNPASGVTISDPNAAEPTLTFNGGSGSYTVTATISNGVCADETFTQRVTVGTLPVVTVAPIEDACDKVRLNPSVDYGIDEALIDSVRWIVTKASGPDAGTEIYNGRPWNRDLDVVEVGDYIFTAVAYNGCAPAGAGTDVTFSVLDGPPVTFELDIDRVCRGGSITVTNTSSITKGPQFFVYDASGNEVASGSKSPFTFTYDGSLVAGQYTIRLELKDKKCGTGSEEATIYLLSDPEVSLDPIADGCGTATINLSATHTDEAQLNSISWEIRNAGGSVVYTDATFDPAAAVLPAGTYTAAVTVTNGCSSTTDQQSFRVVDGTAASFTLDASDVCQGGTVTATNTTAGLTDIRFSLLDGTGTELAVSTDANATFTIDGSFAAGTYTVRLEGNSADCGGGLISIEETITVTEGPQVTLNPVADACGSLTFTPAATTANAASIRYEITKTGGVVVYSDDTFTPAEATLGVGEYTLTATVSSGCGSATDAVSFTVTGGITPTFSLDTDAICEGGTFTVFNTSIDILVPTFTVTDASGNTVANSVISPFTFGGDLAPGTYTLRMQGTSVSCGGTTGVEQPITVGERPTVTVDPIADACGSVTFTPSGSWTAANSIVWEVRNASGTVVYTDATFTPAAATLLPGNYTLSAAVDNDCGNASDAVTFSVGGDPASTVTFDLDQDATCEGGTITVSNTSVGLSNVTFTIIDRFGNGLMQSSASPYTFGSDLPAGDYTVRMTGDSDLCGGASVSKDAPVTIEAAPQVEVNPVADQCGSITFVPSARIAEANVVEWTIRNTAGAVVYTDETFSPAAATLPAGFYTLIVEVANNCGIADDATTFEVTGGEAPVFTLDSDVSCAGSTITATNATPDLINVVFTVTDAGGNTVATSTTSPFTFGDDLPVGAYTVRMEGNSTSCAAGTVSTEQTVTFNTTPTVTLDPVADACGSLSFTPVATVTDATAISWEIRNGDGEIVFTDTNQDPGLITLGPGTYAMTAAVSNACNADDDRVTFTVESPDPATLTVDVDDICAGERITVRNTATGLDDVRFTVANENGFTVASGSGSPFTFGSGLPAGTYSVTMNGNSRDCSGAPVSADTVVTIRAKAFIDLDPIAGNCGSVTLTPSATYTSAEGIMWSIRDAAGVEVYRDDTFDPVSVTLAPGFYTLTGIVFNECGTDDDVTTFEVGDGTEPTFVLDTEVNCEGNTFTVTNTTADLSNMRFVIRDESGAILLTSTSSPFTFGGGFTTGTYTVQMEGNSFSCSPDLVTQEATVEVVNVPTVSVDPVVEACGMSDFVPSATIAFASAIEWSILDAAGTVVYTDDRFEPRLASLPAGAYTLIAAVTNDCGAAEDRTTFTVNPGPTPNFSLSSSSVCSGGSLIATNRSTGDVDDFLFEVIDGDGTVIMTSTASPATFTFDGSQPVGTYTVRLTVSSATCAPVSNSTEVSLGESPMIALNPTPDQCAPAAVTLSATHTDASRITFVNWQIRDASGKLVYNNDTFDPPAAELEEGTYYVTATVANGCGVDRSRDTFRLMPGANPVLALDTDQICSGDFFTATNGNPEVSDVTFTVTDAMGITLVSGTTSPFVFGDDLAPGTYTLRMEGSSAACGGMAAIDTLVSISGDADVVLDPVADACGSLTFVPNATVTDAMTINWTITDALGATVYTDDTFIPAPADLGPGSYVLTARVGNDCGTANDAVSFTVGAPEAPTFTVSVDDICEKQTVTVTSTTTGLEDLTFTVRNDAGVVVATGNGSPYTFGSALPGGIYTVTLRGTRTDCGGAAVSSDTSITIRPVPTVVLEDVEGQCGSYTFTPAATVEHATSISWSIRNAGGLVVYTDDTFAPAAVTLGPGFYTLSVDAANGCGIAEDVTTFEVTTGTPPTFALSADNSCAGESFTVTNTTSDLSDLSFTVRDQSGTTVATGVASPFRFGADLPAGTYTVRMEGTSASCPNSPASVETEVTVATVPTVAVTPVSDACGSVTFVPAASTTDATRMDWTITDASGTVLYTEAGFTPGQVTLGTGTYTLAASVGNDCGNAVDRVSFTVSAGDEPTFALDKDESCVGSTFTATSTTPGLANPTFTVINSDGDAVASGSRSPFTFGAGLSAGSYTVRLTGFATDCGDAPVASERGIQIQPDPTVDVDVVAGTCGSLTFTPSAAYTDATGIDWKIRNGAGTLVYSDATFTPAEVSLNPGFYTLLVEVSNECRTAADFTTFEITEGSPATFSLSTEDVCAGETVTVTNTSTDLADLSFTVSSADGTVVATGSSSPFTFGSGLAAGTYTVRMEGTSTTCASGIIGTETTVQINNAPTVVVAPVTTEFCGTSDFRPEAETTFADRIDWEVRDAAGTVVYSSTEFRPADVELPAGDYTLQATVTNDCGSASDAVAFTVIAAPIANFSLSSSSACAGSTITATNLSSGDIDAFTFTVLDTDWNVVLTSNESPATFSFGDDFPVGQYIVRLEVSSASCAPVSSSTRITVGAAPSIVLDPQADLCGPNDVQLSATFSDPAGINFINWQIRDESGRLIYNSDAFAPPVASLLEGTYLVTATVANGCGVVRSRDTFELYEAPRPSFTVDSEIACQGGTLTVTNTSGGDVTGFTFSFIDPLGTTMFTSSASPATFAIGEGLPDGDYLLRLAAGNPECGEETAEMTITVGGAPTVEVVAQPDYCGPTAVTLSAAYRGADRMSWEVTDADGRPVFRSDIADAPTLNLEPGTYAVAATVSSDCGTSVSRDTFRIYAEPVADLSLSATELCLDGGNTVTVRNGSTDDALDYIWTVSPAAGVGIDDDRSATPTFTFAGEGSYTVSARIANPSCEPIAWSASVDVKAGVDPVLVNQDRFCEILDLTPVVTYGDGTVDSVYWSFPGSEGDLTSTERYPSSIPYRDAGTFVYSLTVYNACGETTVADTIYLDALPVVTMGGRDTVCILDGVYSLTAASPAGGVWTDLAGRPGVVTSDGDFDPVAAGTGVTTLQYTVTDGACSTTGTREVFVIEKPEVAVSEPVLDVCASESYFVLSNGNPAGGWYEGPGVVDQSGVMDPSSLGVGTYTLTYHYRPAGMTCTGSVDFTVNVRPGPIAAIDAPDYVCVGEAVQFKQVGSGGVTFTWRNSDDPPVRQENPVFTFETAGIHTVSLTAFNEFGCPHTVVKHVNVTDVPVARFEKEQEEACQDQPFTFYNNSQVFGEATYLWDFGNGRTSNSENPAPVLFARGTQDTTYTVRLTVTNDCGTHTFTDEVTITTEPVAAFDLSEDNGCSQLNVSFENRTAGTRNRYKWFVNGELYSVEATPPSRSFIAEGTQNATFEIMLVAYNACGSDTLTRTVISKPNELRVRFSADERDGCDPLTVRFRNFSSPDSLVAYTWNFGDGYSSDEKEPSHTFRNTTASVKTYNVTLTADNGCTRDEVTLPVTVYPAPDVSFEVSSVTCAGDSVFFRNTSGRVTDLVWTFGDGTTIRDAQTPGHVFPGPGEYTVTLSAKVEGADCPGVFNRTITIREAPQVDLTADNVVGCPPLQVDLQNLTEAGSYFSWNFGDGNTAVGAAPGTHTYTTPGTYEITLTVRDEFGCSNDAVFSAVEVHDLPEVAFAADASQACGVPQAVCFTNKTTGGTGYAWDFGNGVTSGLTAPCMTYTEAGTYDVTLTATNDFLCTASATAPLSIYGEPVAEFSVPDTAACAAGELPFTSSSENTDFIKWSFSDGYVSNEENFRRRFDEPGFYDVTVIAGNASGCSDTATFTNFVEVYPRPVADFTFDNAEGEAMNTIQFTDRSSADAVYFGWDFGDGYQSEEMNPVHRYLSGFDKTVYHWVENDYGCQDTAQATVKLEMIVGLFVPNIFTPDDNTVEEQDVFKPKGIGLEDYYIAVYTRTGQLVWESDAIDAEGKPIEAWDGTFHGRPAKPGTYVWRVHRAKFRNGRGWTGMANEKGTIAKTGYVTLLR